MSFLVCKRSIPATAGVWPPLALALAELGHEVAIAPDGPVDISGHDVVLLWGNPGWYPAGATGGQSWSGDRRAVMTTFHAEPLRPPKASGLPRWSSLNAGEVARILRRDPGATDIYTNAVRLRRIVREGWLDLIFATSLEKVEYLQEQGIQSWYVPYGYHPSFGKLLGLERTIDVLFLGDPVHVAVAGCSAICGGRGLPSTRGGAGTTLALGREPHPAAEPDEDRRPPSALSRASCRDAARARTRQRGHGGRRALL